MSMKNRIGMGDSHAHMGDSVESLSTSLRILLLQKFQNETKGLD